ncbi:putative ABC transport system ATP-binding protein [Curtobacterium sp. PhB130]|uniref:ABC transporter ATP-binding protein n=1 Tax=Curtobacterium sp. PhB130 TaxID=2485178 RepID=UPI000F4BA196|nr:ATP-binding cassette domain-containing protein [Curtobacterium sp. PhB130]ROS72217.1 putative ABC transport system ATP-binding protein [Curtobacterium sp. PhB130]
MSNELIRATSISKSHGGTPLWSDVTFVVHDGSSLAITGPSGSGKSTLLRCLGLLSPLDTGTIEIGGHDVTNDRGRQRSALYRSTIGHLFQNGALEDNWSVRRNLDVAFIGSSTKRPDRALLRRAALSSVGLDLPEGARTHTLSGGERQRLALARLFIRRPPVVFADEPTAALDVTTGADVLTRLSELRDAGAAIVVATHDPAVMAWADEGLDLSPRG